MVSKPLHEWKEKEEKEQNQEEPKQGMPLSSANFPLYHDWDVYGLGYTCEPAQGSGSHWLETANGL